MRSRRQFSPPLPPSEERVKWMCYPATRCQENRGADKYVAHRTDDHAAINASWAFTAATSRECCTLVLAIYPQAQIEVMN